MKDLFRCIRADDFPHGDLNLFHEVDRPLYREKVSQFIKIFESSGVPYILGVSPLILQPGDVEFLNDNIISGETVLHGFTHGWERPWDSITEWRVLRAFIFRY